MDSSCDDLRGAMNLVQLTWSTGPVRRLDNIEKSLQKTLGKIWKAVGSGAELGRHMSYVCLRDRESSMEYPESRGAGEGQYSAKVMVVTGKKKGGDSSGSTFGSSQMVLPHPSLQQCLYFC